MSNSLFTSQIEILPVSYFIHALRSYNSPGLDAKGREEKVRRGTYEIRVQFVQSLQYTP